MIECTSQACEIITETVFPLLGCFTAYFIFLSPFKEIHSLRSKNEVCKINPFPSIMIFCNCLCQDLYSFVIHNHWTFWPNVGGIILGQYYIMILFSSNLKPKDFNISLITLLVFTLLDICGGALSFILFKNNYDAAKNSMGIIGIIILCGVYVSPLTTVFEVIKTKNSNSINFLTTVALTLNGAFWLTYGLFFNDFYIWFPNGLGVISALLQFLLFFIYPRKATEEKLINGIKLENVSVDTAMTLQ
ncbi:hypothetical protein H8356DRAFT_1308824 [Neocallimastix lanati (nom. inval.)]|uniref:Sugar transporter SWEET1 n=1 Tax=Neocallimastix californiae TaxID=1754190 RepID=A0A1Y2BZF2_9FUNG|nr:hypothetical protein H8356DRAFT_1308824 [Neocallimastix sp. JGI-2020a]ORY39445.1 hypothetical protein LY90DRAFT_672410 [Neocallimastix californiae]|eukprot:ORY39445.1 hypothetical protein LY90DRAFT_672410 [Neocallimastix californiae]